jgi:ubiquinone/menaquinone biosynthesis C-methylase UbiE
MDFKTIYRTEAERYDLLVSREDYQGNILQALEKIRPLTNLDVFELGAGTGRLTRLLAPHIRQILATDLSAHMLTKAKKRMRDGRYRFAAAENGRLPAADHSADLVIAGWSLGHLTGWHPDDWPWRVDQVVGEMKRLLRPNGTAIILETLGTGRENPQPPTAALAQYYGRLETQHSFQRTWIRTDYRFHSVEEAEMLTRFFFGDKLADWITNVKITLLPECTGIWYWTGDSHFSDS